jgi:hypothetical protein
MMASSVSLMLCVVNLLLLCISINSNLHRLYLNLIIVHLDWKLAALMVGFINGLNPQNPKSAIIC